MAEQNTSADKSEYTQPPQPCVQFASEVSVPAMCKNVTTPDIQVVNNIISYLQVCDTEYRKNVDIYDENSKTIAEKDAAIAERNAVIAEKDAVIAEKDAVIAEKDETIEGLNTVIAEKKKLEILLAESESMITERYKEIAEKDATIISLRSFISLRDRLIKESNVEINKLKDLNEELIDKARDLESKLHCKNLNYSTAIEEVENISSKYKALVADHDTLKRHFDIIANGFAHLNSMLRVQNAENATE
jgi:chromosome segregation ATPase